MNVTTTRLVLRRPSEADLKAILEVHSDPETNVHNPTGPMKGPSEAVLRLEEWTKGWLEHGYGYWTVAHLDRPETVSGFGGVMKKQITPELFDNNLYFRFRPEAWGQGYAGELVEVALEHTFKVANQPRVLALTRDHNAASRKTIKKAGFEQMGVIGDVSGAAPSLLYALGREAYSTRKTSESPTHAVS